MAYNIIGRQKEITLLNELYSSSISFQVIVQRIYFV